MRIKKIKSTSIWGLVVCASAGMWLWSTFQTVELTIASHDDIAYRLVSYSGSLYITRIAGHNIPSPRARSPHDNDPMTSIGTTPRLTEFSISGNLWRLSFLGVTVSRSTYKAYNDNSESSARPCLAVGVSYLLVLSMLILVTSIKLIARRRRRMYSKDNPSRAVT